jgi:hypothetical protein
MDSETIKQKVLEHLKSLMADSMSKDMISKDNINNDSNKGKLDHADLLEVHKLPALDTYAKGKDSKGNPMEMESHEEETIGHGILNPKGLMTKEANEMPDEEGDYTPITEAPLHPLFSKPKKEIDPEEDNHSFISNLKKAKRKQ